MKRFKHNSYDLYDFLSANQSEIPNKIFFDELISQVQDTISEIEDQIKFFYEKNYINPIRKIIDTK